MIERRVTHRSSAWPLRDRARSMDNADPQPVHLTMAEMCPKKPDHFSPFDQIDQFRIRWPSLLEDFR